MLRSAYRMVMLTLGLLAVSCSGTSDDSQLEGVPHDAGMAPSHRSSEDGLCESSQGCESGVCEEGRCVESATSRDASSVEPGPDGFPPAGDDNEDAGASRCFGAEEACFRSSECCAGLRCRQGLCQQVVAVDAGQEGVEETADAGPVVCPELPIGVPCVEDEECGEGGHCMVENEQGPMPGGYCYADSAELGCCPEGSQIPGTERGSTLCMQQCVTDGACRVEEGYACIHGICVPLRTGNRGEEGLDEGQNTGFEREDSTPRCRDGRDNDEDGVIDCEDPDCALTAPCDDVPDEWDLATCTDGEDNDGDGQVDCDDPGCRQVVGACAQAQDGGIERSVVQCTDALDNDGDELVDCLDPDCSRVGACQPGDLREDDDFACGDSQDNDEDGQRDCEDPDCLGTFPCPVGAEQCQDGQDNDGNGLVDCDDPACDEAENCGNRIEEDTVPRCTNRRDDDLDGLTDCQDPDCVRIVDCGVADQGESSLARCVNGIDDGGDGDVDCEDTGCRPPRLCGGPCGQCADVENTDDLCADRADNDADGLIDCDDEDCVAAQSCEDGERERGGEGQLGGLNCTDGLDNDADELVDCEDPDCAQAHQCGELVIGEGAVEGTCADGLDNDGDNLSDCDDPECALLERCLEEAANADEHGREGPALDSCENGLDDDDDDAIDCEDEDCEGTRACGGG